jgi:hypothetical protein
VRTDNSVLCWGDSLIGPSFPAAGGFTAMTVGDYDNCGLRIDGSVKCWGDNTWNERAVPAGGFIQVDAGAENACGLRPSGAITCWGDNTYGESTPPTGAFRAISVGEYSACGLRPDLTTSCWPSGSASPGSGRYSSISVGSGYACGIKQTDNTLQCSGSISTDVPQPSGTFRSVAVGTNHACGVRTDQTVACWGSNDTGQSTPPTGTFLSVAAGQTQSCGLKSDHTLACWGDADSGDAAAPSGTFTSVAAGYLGSCGVRTDGVFQCWGAVAALGGPLGQAAQLPAMAVGTASLVEGNSGQRNLAFSVTLSKPALINTSAHYTLSDGTAAAGSDYLPASGTITVKAGTASRALLASVVGDRTVEPNETIRLSLSAPMNASLARSSTTGTILNDDPAPSRPRVSIGNAAVIEGRSGQRSLYLTVSLSKPVSSTVKIAYASHDGTAHTGSDYVARQGTVTLPPGHTSTVLAISIKGDAIHEADETFTVALSHPSGANAKLGRSVGTATILNDD